MPVDQQADQPIAMAMAVAPERGEKLRDLDLSQVLPDPVGIVALPALRPTGRITLLFVLRSCTTFADIVGLSTE
jgi:hypothetical protein